MVMHGISDHYVKRRLWQQTVVGGAGFLLNNEMDDFSVKPGVAEYVRSCWTAKPMPLRPAKGC